MKPLRNQGFCCFIQFFFIKIVVILIFYINFVEILKQTL